MSEKSIRKQFVVFKLGEEEYGIDILRVKTIEKMSKITRVPKTQSYVKGVINLRGEVIPVINLKEKFESEINDSINFNKDNIDYLYSKDGETCSERNNENNDTEEDDIRIIIIYADDVIIGIVVDSASEVIEIESSLIEDPPESLGNVEKSSISGIGKLGDRVIILLDAYKILGI